MAADTERTLANDANDDICDVPGILVGHDTQAEAATGCTVVFCAQTWGGAVGAGDVRGGAPATREIALLAPTCMMQEVHAVVLTGGSAYGLDAATGVMRALEARGLGFDVAVARVPIVPAAALFDLTIGRADVRPDAASGERALAAARKGPVAQGSVGAGTGATVGKMAGPALSVKSGLGSASARLPSGHTLGVIVAVNAVGDVYDPATGQVVAGARRPDGDGWLNAGRSDGSVPTPSGPLQPGMHTTIGVIATDLPLGKADLTKLAQMGHDGYALAIRPAHLPFDGDTIFALSTSPQARATGPAAVLDLALAGALAAQTMGRAIVKAVQAATSLAGVPAVRDLPFAS